MRPPVFVINLARSADRRARMSRVLAAAGLAHEFVQATDGVDLHGAEAALAAVPQPHLGRPLSRGEIGCLCSHLALLERIARERPVLAIVLEDDVALGADAVRVIDAAGASARRWDVLLLGHHSARHPPADGAETCFARAPLTDRHGIARVAEFAMGAYAYAVTPRGAAGLLALARPLRMPMDWVTGYAPAAGVRLHAVTPPCIVPDGPSDAVSTIDRRESAPPAPPTVFAHLRTQVGRAWLVARKAGVFPSSYVKRF